MKLSNAEEQSMEIIWKSETSFLKDMMEHYPNPQPVGKGIRRTEKNR